MADSYQKVGYNSIDIGYGSRPAILVVDWQVAFTDPKYALGGLPRLHAARDETVKLLTVARAAGIPVAACYTAYCSQKDMPWWKVAAVREEFIYGHACTAMDPLITFLVRQNIDTVIITGCTTSGCVRATIVDAFSLGLRVQVPADCCGDAEEGPHLDALRDCGRRYCDITTRAAVETKIRLAAAA